MVRPRAYLFGRPMAISNGGIVMFEGFLQPMHLLLIFGVVLVVFGPKNLPGVGKGLGESIREFKNAFDGEDENSPKKLRNQEDRKQIE
jgi:TatA/E family protein of Tat protein translocase